MSDAFNSDDTRHMAKALWAAMAELKADGRLDGANEEAVQAVLTKAIIAAAEQGERDERWLAAYAVARYSEYQPKPGDLGPA